MDINHTPHIPSGTIVVGMDGSAPSDLALRWALDQAVLEHRPITLAHGTSASANSFMARAGVAEDLETGQALLSRAAAVVRAHSPAVDLAPLVQSIDARQSLLELSSGAALIVLGSRGRGTLKTMFLGSVSLFVSRHAACPVVVLRPQDVANANKGIVVGVDGSEGSAAAIEFAYRQASVRALPLTVFHGFSDPLIRNRGPRYVPVGEAGYEEYNLLVAESVAGMSEKFPDVKVRVRLARGLAHECMVEASKGAGMVVVGTHPTNAALDMIRGEVSRAVIEHAHCAVAVVPDPS